jgi:hypothetical protein
MKLCLFSFYFEGAPNLGQHTSRSDNHQLYVIKSRSRPL